MGIYEELVARGLIAQVTNEDEIREMRDSVMPEGAEKDIEVEIGAFDDIVSADEDAARGE